MMVKFIDNDHTAFQMGDGAGCRVGLTRVEHYWQHVKKPSSPSPFTITIMQKMQKAQDMADISVTFFQCAANFWVMQHCASISTVVIAPNE